MKPTPSSPKKNNTQKATRPKKTTLQGDAKPRASAIKTTRQKVTPTNTRIAPSSSKIKWLLGGVLLVLLIATAGLYWSFYSPLNIRGQSYHLTVERGQNYSQVLDKMGQEGIIGQPWLAKIYFKVVKPKPLQTGTYLFKKNLSLLALLKQLANGEGLLMTKITVIEGMSFKQLLAQLRADGQVKQTLTSQTEAEVLKKLAIKETHPEGLFAPDTYKFSFYETDIKILKYLYAQQQRILQQAWHARAPNLPYKTPYEALIMASIVEKETGAAAERPLIAGVFINRLRLGMRLQTDPTVIYGMGDSYNGNIRKSDLLTYTPYNTYKINGLPPTPIALPSKAAIEAALKPAQTKALYFVAKGDGSGEHNFSETLVAHNQAVNAYLQARKEKK